MAGLCSLTVLLGTLASRSPLPLLQKSQSSPRAELQADLLSIDCSCPIQPHWERGKAPAWLSFTHIHAAQGVRAAQVGKGIFLMGQ